MRPIPFFLIGFCLLLTSCGFHLRSSDSASLQAVPLTITSTKPYGDLHKKVRRQLSRRGAMIVNADEKPAYTLQLISESRKPLSLTIGRDAQTSTRLLTYLLRFKLLDDSKHPITPVQTISQSRDSRYSPNQELAQKLDNERLYAKMQDNAITELVLRVSALTRATIRQDVPAANEVNKASSSKTLTSDHEN